MPKTTYDPNATYEVVKGPVTIKGKGNLRTLLQTGEKTKLSHLKPHEVAFLVEKKKVHKLAGGKA
jgi:hypothetical protein